MQPTVDSTLPADEQAPAEATPVDQPVDGPTEQPEQPTGQPAEASAEPPAGQAAGQAVEPPARPATPDSVCAAATALALEAAVEVAEPDTVGLHLGVLAEGERVVTHYFACTAKGYRGWRWSVTLARAPRARHATVSEVVLLPGDDAVMAPEWLPWSQRLAPGDLGAGDELPYKADDPLLDPGYTVTDDEEADRVAVWELGLGRPRVLNREGRQAAAERWYTGSHGPTAGIALGAQAACSSCGYFLPMAGALRQVFGVCANEWSPSDGTVVSHDHGCGAHSETDVEPPAPVALPDLLLDERGAEPVVVPRRVEDSAAADTDVAAAAPEVEDAEAAAADAEAADVEAADVEAADVEVADVDPPADVEAEAAPEAEVTADAPAEVETEVEVEAAEDAAPLDAASPQDEAPEPGEG